MSGLPQVQKSRMNKLSSMPFLNNNSAGKNYKKHRDNLRSEDFKKKNKRIKKKRREMFFKESKSTFQADSAAPT